jgi:hypothetical protein
MLTQLAQLVFNENNFQNYFGGFPSFSDVFIRAIVPKLNSVDSFDARTVQLAM